MAQEHIAKHGFRRLKRFDPRKLFGRQRVERNLI